MRNQQSKQASRRAGLSTEMTEMSTGNADDEEKHERARPPSNLAKVRSRKAAKKCRQRQKIDCGLLANRVNDMESLNSYLKDERRSLRDQVLKLKHSMLEHADCKCTLIHKYISVQAAKAVEGQSSFTEQAQQFERVHDDVLRRPELTRKSSALRMPISKSNLGLLQNAECCEDTSSSQRAVEGLDIKPPPDEHVWRSTAPFPPESVPESSSEQWPENRNQCSLDQTPPSSQESYHSLCYRRVSDTSNIVDGYREEQLNLTENNLEVYPQPWDGTSPSVWTLPGEAASNGCSVLSTLHSTIPYGGDALTALFPDALVFPEQWEAGNYGMERLSNLEGADEIEIYGGISRMSDATTIYSSIS